MRRDFDGYLFDLDGTLWDATENIRRVWSDTLRENGYPPVTKEQVKRVMGLPMDALFAALLPALTPEERTRVGLCCMQRENAYLSQHGGRLYPGLEETLRALSARARLFIVSNCQSGYIEAFLAAHRLSEYFSAYRCFGDNGKQKGVNIRLIVDGYALKRPVYIGDTALDRQGALEAGVPFLHAAYGFGAVEGADRIGALRELI